MDKVIIGVASQSSVVTQFAMALADLAAYKSPNYEYCGIINVQGVLIDDARNRIVNQFLSTDADWLMMFDTDVEFKIDVVDKLLAMHKACKTKVGCGWYKIRVRGDRKAAIFFFMDNGQWSSSPIITESTPEYFPADAGPSGAMLIHRDVFQTMRTAGEKHYFKFTHTDDMTITEDIYFCRLLKKYGFEFMVCKEAFMNHYKVQAL